MVSCVGSFLHTASLSRISKYLISKQLRREGELEQEGRSVNSKTTLKPRRSKNTYMEQKIKINWKQGVK